MPRPVTLSVLADLAEDQWGLFTRRQAEATGMAWTTLNRLATGDAVERIAHGVYRMRGAPSVDHLDLRAAWLQLAPDVAAWDRTPRMGVVSHRSAAAVYGLGHLPTDVHEFTLPVRRQSRRPDVRLHRAHLDDGDCHWRGGLLVTRPARIAADLLAERHDLDAVGYVIGDALRGGHDDPRAVVNALAPLSHRFGLPNHDGLAITRRLLDRVAAPETLTWLAEASPTGHDTSTPDPPETGP